MEENMTFVSKEEHEKKSCSTKRVDPSVPVPAPTTYDFIPPEMQPNAELSENEA